MKNIIFTLIGIAILSLTSCSNNEDEINDLQNQLDELSSNQDDLENEFSNSLDSILNLIENNAVTDINALKMGITIPLFDGIIRQPALAETLINLSETIYIDYTELLPFTDNTILVRAEALDELFESIARQEETFDLLNDTATQFVGPFDPNNMSDNAIIEGKARGVAISGLILAIARQPGLFETLRDAATNFVGDYDPDIFSDELMEAARAEAVVGLIESITRQPDEQALYNEICIQFLDFSFL